MNSCAKSLVISLYTLGGQLPKSFLSVAFDKSRLFKSQFAAAVPKQVTQINALVIEQGYCELGWGDLWTSGLCGPS